MQIYILAIIEYLTSTMQYVVKKVYFNECQDHNHHEMKDQSNNITKKIDKNFFCMNCMVGSLSETWSREKHIGHKVLQV